MSVCKVSVISKINRRKTREFDHAAGRIIALVGRAIQRLCWRWSVSEDQRIFVCSQSNCTLGVVATENTQGRHGPDKQCGLLAENGLSNCRSFFFHLLKHMTMSRYIGPPVFRAYPQCKKASGVKLQRYMVPATDREERE